MIEVFACLEIPDDLPAFVRERPSQFWYGEQLYYFVEIDPDHPEILTHRNNLDSYLESLGFVAVLLPNDEIADS